LYDYVLSPKDIIKVLNLSKTRIRQIEQKILKKIEGAGKECAGEKLRWVYTIFQWNLVKQENNKKIE